MKNEKDTIKQFSDNAELRNILGSIELRSEGEGEETPTWVYGTGVVFNQWTEIRTPFGSFMEMIKPSALDECDMSDIVSCRNHSLELLCSRTTGKPDDLTIVIDDLGVRYSYMPKNECAEALAEDIKLGFIKGSSFIFSSDSQKGSTWERRENPDGTSKVYRTIEKIDKIYEMGGVTFQAYGNANAFVSARSQSIIDEILIPKPMSGADFRNKFKLEKYKQSK